MDVLNISKATELKQEIIEKVWALKDENPDIGALLLSAYDEIDEAKTTLEFNKAYNEYLELLRFLNNAVKRGILKLHGVSENLYQELVNYGASFTVQNGSRYTCINGMTFTVTNNSLIYKKHLTLEKTDNKYRVSGEIYDTKIKAYQKDLGSALKLIAELVNGGIRR